jgi:RNA polymerase sigma factor (sigma-70 family)
MATTTDPAHRFDELIQVAFSPFFGNSVPPILGSEAFKITRSRLSSKGLPDPDHASEVVDRALIKSLEYLNVHGGESVRQPRAWFHRICRNESARYIREVMYDSESVISLAEGETDLLDVNIFDHQMVETLLRSALEHLPPRHRELIRLDMVERLPAPEIEAAMGIHSHAYFLKLKSEAFTSLKQQLKNLMEQRISSIL